MVGTDAGFDMVPPLSDETNDREKWNQFICEVKTEFADDNKVVITPNFILFKVGEGPMLPLQGYKFLRFSAQITGVVARRTNIQSYIDTVTRLAEAQFGSRVRAWDETVYESGHYDWQQVYQSFNHYYQ